MAIQASILLATRLPPEEQADWLARLAALLFGEIIVTGCDQVDRGAIDIAIVANPAPGALQFLPRLGFIHSLWAGVDRLLEDETVPDVPIVRLVDPALARTMAEATAALVLHLHRDLPRYALQQRKREWRPHPVLLAKDRRVAVLGMGEMGWAAARLLRTIGFDVRGWSRSGSAVADIETFSGPSGLHRALDKADILVNLLPLTLETRGILNHAVFTALAPGAGLINFGRGGHLVEADVLAALASGTIGHAVLDVFEQEPLPPAHPFWTHPGITILPHVSAPTTKDTAAAIVAAAVKTYRATGRLPTAVDRLRGY